MYILQGNLKFPCHDHSLDIGQLDSFCQHKGFGTNTIMRPICLHLIHLNEQLFGFTEVGTTKIGLHIILVTVNVCWDGYQSLIKFSLSGRDVTVKEIHWF